MADFTGLNDDFTSRIRKLMAAAPGQITLVSGFRSNERQAELVAKAKRKYGDGWRKWVAPPGKSNHNRGIAADLGFESDFVQRWVHANAQRFGLVFPMSHEPWHIEPLGNRDVDPDAYTVPPEEVETLEDRMVGAIQSVLQALTEDGSVDAQDVLGTLSTTDPTEISEFEEADFADIGEDVSVEAAESVGEFSPERQAAEQTGTLAEFSAGRTTGAGQMNPVAIARAAQRAGFRGDALVTAVAVAMAESSGNPNAHNPNAGTGDNSFGLWQINMLGGMGPERRQRFGLRSNEQLFDPIINARAAFGLSNGGRNFTPWTTFNKDRHTKFLGTARQAVKSVQSEGVQRARRRAR